MLPAERQSLADTMASVARTMNRRVSLEETLTAIVGAARDTIDGIDFVGISIVHRRGRIETAAATDPIVYTADQLQYELNEGPAIDAAKGEDLAAADDLATDARWPAYAPRGAALGIGSQAGVELYDEPETLGVLNLYARQANVLDSDRLQTAHLFAVHAALALGHALKQTQLTDAVGTRQMIGQAVGIVMERYQLDEVGAFSYLTRVSQHSNIKLRVVAEELVQEVADQHTQR